MSFFTCSSVAFPSIFFLKWSTPFVTEIQSKQISPSHTWFFINKHHSGRKEQFMSCWNNISNNWYVFFVFNILWMRKIDFWPAINAYIQIITWALLIEYHFQIVCMLTLLHGGKRLSWFEKCLGVEAHGSITAKLNVKQNHEEHEVNWTTYQMCSLKCNNCSKHCVTVVIFDCLPPLVYICTTVQWSRLCHNIWVNI